MVLTKTNFNKLLKRIFNSFVIQLKNNKYVCVIFSIILSFGIEIELRTKLSYEIKFVMFIILFIISFIISIIFLVALDKLYTLFKNKIFVKNINEYKRKIYSFCAFICIWLVCFIVFLNLYPCVLSSDSLAQIRQSFSLSFDNFNPLIHTLFITIFVQIGVAIKDVALGLSLYTIFQFTMYSFACYYFIKVLLKNKVNMFLVVASNLFFLWPTNIIYATGMWKDTFFAIFLLLTLTYSFDLVSRKCKIKKYQYFIIIVLVLITSLSRNGGWSALLIGYLVSFIFLLRKNRYRNKKYNNLFKLNLVQLGTVIFSIIIMLFIYPLFGIKSEETFMVVSLPLQQMSRVIVNGNYTQGQLELIGKYCREDNFALRIINEYDKTLVDPLRDIYDFKVIQNNMSGFLHTYLKLGLTQTRAYYEGIVDHTCNFWWPFSKYWLYDMRICENEFGVVRTPIIFPNRNIAQYFQYKLTSWRSFMTIFNIFNNCGFTLWMVLICVAVCNNTKNSYGKILCVPFIAIYVLLIITSFGGLFRYVYQSVLCMPILILYGSINIEDKI